MAAALLTPDILNEKQRRLKQLQTRAARQGYDTPAEVANEIVDLQREIAASGAMASVRSTVESHSILYDLLMETRADVRRLYWLIPLLLMLVVIAVKL